VFLIALVGLRELSPQLRDQLMVTMRDRALIEARAKGLDVDALLKNHWRQLLKVDIIVSAIAVSLMLLVYYALVGFLVIYATSIFGYSLQEANHRRPGTDAAQALRGGADRALEGTAGDAVPGQRAIRLGDRQVTPGRTGNEGWPP
jgi:hypothetical protein